MAKDIGLVNRQPTSGAKGRYGKFDAPVAAKKSNGYTQDAAVVQMTKQQQRDYELYHQTKGKMK